MATTDEAKCTATPYLCVADTAAALDFYRRAFGAVETMRVTQPDGRIGHAEIRVGGAPIFISDEYPEIGVRAPASLGGSPVMVVLDVPDVDAAYARAVAAGATVDRPVAGPSGVSPRNGKLTDPFGHRWMLSTSGA